MDKKRGVVLFTGGHPNHGYMARNLAMGIKLYSDIEIALFHDESSISHFNDWDKSFFTLHHLPEFTYKSKPDSFLRVKTFLPEISPFDETIFFDVDLIWHPGRKVDELFDSLKDVDFTMINEGHLDLATGENQINRNYHFWAKPDAIKRGYAKEKGLKDAMLYQFRSEFIYFKKTTKNKKYFELARKIYDNPQMESVMFGDVLPDEAAFDVASAILHHYPHQSGYTPVYWEYLYAFMRLDRKDLYSRFYASSMGGKLVKDVQKTLYNDLLKYYFSQYGVTQNYEWKDKIQFAPHHQSVLK